MGETPKAEAQLGTGCDYRGQEFGANYPDSVCVEGYLYDADSGEAVDGGWLFTDNEQEFPCPNCNLGAAGIVLADRMFENWRDRASTAWPEWFFFVAEKARPYGVDMVLRVFARRRLSRYVERMKAKWSRSS